MLLLVLQHHAHQGVIFHKENHLLTTSLEYGLILPGTRPSLPVQDYLKKPFKLPLQAENSSTMLWGPVNCKAENWTVQSSVFPDSHLISFIAVFYMNFTHSHRAAATLCNQWFLHRDYQNTAAFNVSCLLDAVSSCTTCSFLTSTVQSLSQNTKKDEE